MDVGLARLEVSWLWEGNPASRRALAGGGLALIEAVGLGRLRGVGSCTGTHPEGAPGRLAQALAWTWGWRVWKSAGFGMATLLPGAPWPGGLALVEAVAWLGFSVTTSFADSGGTVCVFRRRARFD